MYDTRRYLILPATVVDQINFEQVLETSAETLRYSVDGSQTFVKYELPQRPDIYSEEYTELTHTEMLELLNTTEWTHTDNEI